MDFFWRMAFCDTTISAHKQILLGSVLQQNGFLVENSKFSYSRIFDVWCLGAEANFQFCVCVIILFYSVPNVCSPNRRKRLTSASTFSFLCDSCVECMYRSLSFFDRARATHNHVQYIYVANVWIHGRETLELTHTTQKSNRNEPS